ncbi:MAG: ChbG/HpnK family deacetylase [Candidatus Omnitrophota bacterium]
MAKKIVINADDFGLSRGINEGIINCINAGIVNSVSLVANGSEFEAAVKLLEKNSGFETGIHFVLTEEKALLNKKEIPTLVDKGGYFPRNWFSFLGLFCTGKIKIYEINKELEAQISKMIHSGIKISHIDSHCHIHLLPGIIDLIIKLANKYRINFIRIPSEYCAPLRILNKKGLKVLILNLLSYKARKKIKRNGLFCIDSALGIYNSGNLNPAVFSGIIRRIRGLPFNSFELISHPGTRQAHLAYPHWNYHWENETRLFTSRETKRLLQEGGISLCNRRSLI